jgi:hypothetical protein
MDIQPLIGASSKQVAWVGSAQRDYLYELRGEDAVFAIYDGLPDAPTCRLAEGEWLFRRAGWMKP